MTSSRSALDDAELCPEKNPIIEEADNYGELFNPDRIPDDVLFQIFHSLTAPDRLRLPLVSKRFRTLVYSESKRMWSGIDLLSVSACSSGAASDRSFTINGTMFMGQDKSIAALDIFLECCAPFTNVSISLDSYQRDYEWMTLLVDRITDAQSGKPVSHLSFEGEVWAAPIVLENLVAKDGTAQSMKLHFRRHDAPLNTAGLVDLDKESKEVEMSWKQIALCTGLTSFHFRTFKSDWCALRVLRGKQNLKELFVEYKLTPDEGVVAVAAVANSCPSLSRLTCTGYGQGGHTPLLHCLNAQTLERLQRFDIFLSRQITDPGTLASLPAKLPNLSHSLMIVAGNCRSTVVVPIVKSFLDAWCMEESVKVISLDFKWGFISAHSNVPPIPPLNHPTVLKTMHRFCDSIAMLENGRIGFIKGSVVLACKSLQDEHTPNLEDRFRFL